LCNLTIKIKFQFTTTVFTLPKFYFMLLMYCGFLPTIQAQNYAHSTIWTRFQVSASLPKRWDIMTGLHWRRQNNFVHSKLNFWKEPLLSGVQVQLLRRNKAQTVAFIPIQINYFLSNTLLGREEDFSTPQNREWRASVGIEFTQKVRPKLIFRERLLQEFRFFRSNRDQPVGRIRGRWQASYRWRSSVSINAITELVIHNPPQINGLKPFRFHQFWLGGSLLWRLSSTLNLETGYTIVKTQRSTLIETDFQNVINLNLFLRL